jgi:hypothetical protein
MRSILNRLDEYGNTPLHYARTYPDQALCVLLFSNGAKIDKNPQGVINVNSRTLEKYFNENCITPEGDDIDDEDFRIRNSCLSDQGLKLRMLLLYTFGTNLPTKSGWRCFRQRNFVNVIGSGTKWEISLLGVLG